jgi:hypothetical protein
MLGQGNVVVLIVKNSQHLIIQQRKTPKFCSDHKSENMVNIQKYKKYKINIIV